MFLLHLLQVVTTLYFAGIATCIEAASTSSMKLSTLSGGEMNESLGPRRHLRINEERGQLPIISSIAVKLKTDKEAATWNRIDDWVKNEQTPAHVKKVLKLGKKFNTTLKAAPNYKFYKAYLTKFEGKLDEFLKRDTSTLRMWDILGLQKIKNFQSLQNSDEFQVYVKYINMFDDKLTEAKGFLRWISTIGHPTQPNFFPTCIFAPR